MSELELIRETKRVFDIINKYYPGLIVLRNNLIYLSDASISTSVLGFGLPGSISDNIYGNLFRLSGVFLTLILPCYNNMDQSGSLRMEYDFGLSEQSCMNLFKYNLMVYYKEPDASKANQLGYVIYDREAIERSHTIKNIIN